MFQTLDDLKSNVIAPALSGVDPNFDLDGFVKALRDADLVTYDDRLGFVLEVDDETGVTPRFWDLVEKFDQAALAEARN